MLLFVFLLIILKILYLSNVYAKRKTPIGVFLLSIQETIEVQGSKARVSGNVVTYGDRPSAETDDEIRLFINA